ncbi:retrovirus-related pol polyprotein from transposon TNT 1-94, partial [Tanacetum coccineum]
MARSLGFNDHHSDESEYYPGCDICGSIAHETAECTKKPAPTKRKPRIASQQSNKPTEKYLKESGPKVVFGDNSSCDTEGYGSVNCNEITYNRVVYVNGLKHNLISISQLCDANFKVLFIKTQGTIFNQNNEVVLITPRRRDVYVIDMLSYNEEINACFFAKASNTSLSSLTFSKDKTCSACEKGKHHRASFKTKRSFSISKCLHLLYMDLFGPVKPKTISHNKYTLVIVDEYSRYTWVFCLKKKSDAADYIMYFIRKIENLNVVRVKELRSDNETEGRSPDISYFYVFGCPVHIHNHRDHLGKFNGKADDGFFLVYSLVAKAFKVFNIKRQEMEETYHVTFSEDDEAIFISSIEGDEININENRSFLDDEFLVLRNKVSQCSGNDDYFPYVPTHDPLCTNNISIPDNVTPSDTLILQDLNSSDEHPEFTIADDHPVLNKLKNMMIQNKLKHFGITKDQVSTSLKPAGVTTRSRTRDYEAALAHECLYVNFLFEIEPKKLIEDLEEEGWIISMQEELNQFERNKVWTMVPIPHGKTII